MRVLIGRDGILQLPRRSQHTPTVARLVVACNQIPTQKKKRERKKDEDIITNNRNNLGNKWPRARVCNQKEELKKMINNDSERITSEWEHHPTNYIQVERCNHSFISILYQTF